MNENLNLVEILKDCPKGMELDCTMFDNAKFIGGFICEKRKSEHNGIIPLIYKRIICVLWKGHNYMPVSQEDLEGKRLFECKYCKKQRVW